jgi:hypothetical protein
MDSCPKRLKSHTRKTEEDLKKVVSKTEIQQSLANPN